VKSSQTASSRAAARARRQRGARRDPLLVLQGLLVELMGTASVDPDVPLAEQGLDVPGALELLRRLEAAGLSLAPLER
jgi:hypothetical protein